MQKAVDTQHPPTVLLIMAPKPASNIVSPTKRRVPCRAGVIVPDRGVAPEVLPGLKKQRWREGKRLVPGEVEIGDSQWAHRQKELLNRRLYLKDFWYAAGKGACRFDSYPSKDSCSSNL